MTTEVPSPLQWWEDTCRHTQVVYSAQLLNGIWAIIVLILRQQFSLHQDLKPGKHQDHISTTGIGCMLVVRKYPCTLCANNVMLLEQSLVAWTSTHQIQPIYLLYPKSFLHFKTGADNKVCIFPSDKPRCPKCNNLVWISSAMLP